jgi:hypothetical protein
MDLDEFWAFWWTRKEEMGSMLELGFLALTVMAYGDGKAD